MKLREKYELVLLWFEENMPDAQTELHYQDTFQLLVAVILSAQCTDKRVNLITPRFFQTFPTVFELAQADISLIYEHIKSISYPNSKAKNLKGMAQMLVEDFDGVIPSKFKDLLKLPGVGRKTASVMQIVAFNIPAMPVDTHVFRVSNRLGLTKDSKSPEETEKILKKYIPKSSLGKAHHWLILHGRYVCKARTPLCFECGLRDLCDFYNSQMTLNN